MVYALFIYSSVPHSIKMVKNSPVQDCDLKMSSALAQHVHPTLPHPYPQPSASQHKNKTCNYTSFTPSPSHLHPLFVIQNSTFD